MMFLNSKFQSGIALLALSFSVSASAYDQDFYESEEYNTITSVEVTELTEFQKGIDGIVPGSSEGNTSVGGVIDEASIILDKIIAMGDKVWKIIEKNKPVVNQTYETVSAVPQGIKEWQQLTGWSMPQVRVYKMDYKNFYGMSVVTFSYRVAYTYGGSVNGKGKYLASVTAEPAVLNVAWGYKFNVAGQVLNVANAGTTEDPMAGIELRLDWSVDTVMKHMQESTRFYVRGDGLFSNLSDGNMPALRSF
jgi:hypothetical protein